MLSGIVECATMAQQHVPCPEVQWSELSPGHNDPSAVVLGKGAFAKVYRATYATMDVAVKVLKEEVEIKAEDFEREVRAAASVVHPNTVRLCGAITRGSPKALVLELCRGARCGTCWTTRGPALGASPRGCRCLTRWRCCCSWPRRWRTSTPSRSATATSSRPT